MTYGDYVLDFFYNANGTPIAMRQGYASSNNYTVYYYITNLQGDVIRLVDVNGSTAAYYEYDPYGNAIQAAGSHCNINPLRYRGYVYDNESGLYYLQSRYYDPKICRFINADAFASTGQGILGYNMFAYCLNNPISFVDYYGHISCKYSVAIMDDGGITSDGDSTEEHPTKPQNLYEYVTNSDKQLVLDSEYISFYNGTLVIRHSSDYLTSWALFGVIFLNRNGANETTVAHEYGHILQEQDMGTMKYIGLVFIPSTIYNLLSRNNISLYENYYNMPWEYDADMRGDVNREHAPWSETVSSVYFEVERLLP